MRESKYCGYLDLWLEFNAVEIMRGVHQKLEVDLTNRRYLARV